MVTRQFRVALPCARGYIVVLFSLFGIGIALAAPGNLDPGFGEDGLWSWPIGSSARAHSVAQQSDGKLVLAGTVAVDPFSFDFIVARLAADGTPDGAFGADGIATVDFGGTGDVAFAVIQQSNGKVVLAGTAWTAGVWDDVSSDMALARFNADGSLDTTFGNAGLVTLNLDAFDYAFDVIQQANGKLLVAGATNSTNELVGTSKATFARFNANGSLDTSFGSGGSVSLDFGGGLQSRADSLAQQANGMIVAVGTVRVSGLDSSDMGLMRLTADGVLDPLFDGDGMIAVDFDGNRDDGYVVAIQPDGAIVAAGVSVGGERSDAALLRVNGDGGLDSTFGDEGKSVINLGGRFSVLRSILVRADNSLAATGIRNNSADFANDMIVARFLSNGTLDLTYADEGVATADFGTGNNRVASAGFALIEQADGKLVAVGPAGAARFDDDATFPGKIGFITTNRTVAEATATVVYTARRTGGSAGSVSVDFATAAGQASTGSDFQHKSGTLSWDDGDTSNRSIRINLIDDAEVEGNENFSLTLSEPTDGATLAAAVAVTTIANDDSASGFPGAVGFINTNQTVAEATATVVYTVRRTSGSHGSVGVHYATAAGQALSGSDFQHKSGTLSWDNGDTSDRFITINLIDDAEVEGDEHFFLTLSQPFGGVTLAASEAVTNIANDDSASFPGLIGFIATNQTVAEATATVVYTVRRVDGSDGSVSVTYATAAGQALSGSDFQDASGTLRWDNGDTSDRFITINLIDDAEVEGDENFLLTLSEPTGGATLATTQAVTNIANDDFASGDGDGDADGDGGGGGAFSAWSLAVLCGLFSQATCNGGGRRRGRLRSAG